VKPMPSLRACGARPSGGMSQGEVALRGTAGDGAKSEFCGGMRSARPRGTAMRMPRRLIPTGWLPMTRWPTGDMPGWSDGAIAGVRSPPLRGVDGPSHDGLAGKGPGITRRWSSRRGAVSAPGLQGRAQAKGFHSHRMVADDAVANRGHAWVEPLV
jgi:hypothetical protein